MRIARPARGAKAAQKREQLRDMLWPGSSALIWSRKSNQGFTTIPRLLPLVMHLIKRLSGRSNPAMAYFELWCRSYDEGIVTITDESECAFAAGYDSTRALRTWRENILKLQELGFIKVKPDGKREIGHILLINPIAVCAHIHRTSPDRVPEEWWTAFARRLTEIGAKIPSQGEAKERAG